MKGEFSLQVQQWNSFSLQRSEMFIANEHTPQKSRSCRSETRQRNDRRDRQGRLAPTELRSKERTAKL
jgi:hypothetical protein